MNKMVKKVILSVLLISLSTTNTYPIFGFDFDYIKRFFVSRTSSLVINVRQTFTSLFNVLRRRNENQDAAQLREVVVDPDEQPAQQEEAANAELRQQIEENRQKLRQKDEELQRVNENLLMAQEHAESQYGEIAKQHAENEEVLRQQNNEKFRRQVEAMNQELQEAHRGELQRAKEKGEKQDIMLSALQKRINRLNDDNKELQQRIEGLKRTENENLLMMQEDIASKSREIVERQYSENERLRHQVEKNYQELQQKDKELQRANEMLRIADEINKECERQFGQVRERYAEIDRLRCLNSVTQYDLHQKEDIRVLSKKIVELQKEINDELQILKRKKDELQGQEGNGQQAVSDQIEESSCDKGKEKQREALSSECYLQPKDHWLVKAGFIDPITGVTAEGSGDRDLSCSVIEHSDDEGSIENIGSSSDSGANDSQKSELTGNWVNVDDSFGTEMKLHGNYHFTKRLISPCLQDNGKIIFACVHGTFSNSKSFGTDCNKETTGYLETFAKLLSKCLNRSVSFISFDWSGSSKLEYRKEAGRFLGGKLLKELGDDSQAQIWTFAHSHGANVVAFAAEKMGEHGKKIDCAIHVASPVQDLRDDCGIALPLNAKVLYHFYGIADVTQVIGSAISNCSFNRKLEFNPEAGVRFHNIRLMNNGNELDHIEIKKVVARSLPLLLYNIDTYYPYHEDLDANVFDGDSFPSAWQIAIRNKKKVFYRGLNEGALVNALRHNKAVEDEFYRKYKFSIHDKFGGHSIVQRVLDRTLAPFYEGLSALGKSKLKSESPQSTSS